MEEGGRARVGHLVSLSFALDGDGRVDLGHGGWKVVRGVYEDGAGVADGDAYKFYASPISSEGDE